MSRHTGEWVRIDDRALRGWPLPPIAPDADKEDRGKVLVVGGSREIPGAAQLAAIAALRAGAGKLAIATAGSVSASLGAAVPEARVIALAETGDGAFAAGEQAWLDSASAACVLIGPGMMGTSGTQAFVEALLPLLNDVPVVLDALAMDVVRGRGRFDQPVLLTPHAGEMAHLLRIDKEEVLADPARIAVRASEEWNAVVALKGATTWIAAPDGRRWRYDSAHPGLATSGSGDVLAGLVAGLAARGATLEQACAWGVALHAMAGSALERRCGPLGYLARELPGEVPALLKRLGGARLSRARSPRAA